MGIRMDDAPRVVGRTRDGHFEVGMRRTLAIGVEEAWRLVTSRDGVRAWLGGDVALERGRTFALADGTAGKVRVFGPGSHLRLSWRPEGWAHASILQLRVIAAGEKTTVALHQERLPDAASRTARRAHFAAALDALERLASG